LQKFERTLAIGILHALVAFVITHFDLFLPAKPQAEATLR
jgi:hypothetical protein